MQLADAVFYQLLWTPAAILIASSSKLEQSCFPQHNPLVYGEQGGEPQARGRASTWQGLHMAGPRGDASQGSAVAVLSSGA